MFKKLLRIALVLGGVAMVVALALGWWLKTQIDGGLVEREASRLLEGAAGITAKFGAIRFGKPGTFAIDVLDVKAPKGQNDFSLAFDLLELDYSVSDLLLRFKVKIHAIRLVRPRFRAVIATMPELPKRDPAEPPKKPALDLAFLQKEMLARVEITDGDLEIEDRLEKRPLTFKVKAVSLDLALPEQGSPIRFALSLAPMGGLISAKGQYQLSTAKGEAAVSVNLPDLSFVSGFIEARNPGVKLEKLGLALSGDISKDGEKIDYELNGRVDPLRVVLPPPLALAAGGALAIKVKPTLLELKELKLEADGIAPLALSAKLDGFRDPRELADPVARAQAQVEADVKLKGLTVASLLPHMPTDRMPPALNLSPEGSLDVSAHVTGKLAKPDVVAAVRLSGLTGELKAPPISGYFTVSDVDLAVSPQELAVKKLAVSAMGVDLAAHALVKDWQTAPVIALGIDALDADLAGVLTHLRSPPPPLVKLAPEGKVHVALDASASFASVIEREGIAWPKDAKKLADLIKADVEKLKATPPDRLKPAVEELFGKLGAKVALSVALSGVRAHDDKVPGGVVEADAELRATPDEIELVRLVAGLPGLKAGARLKLTDPLGARQLAAQVVVPVDVKSDHGLGEKVWARLAYLASLAPWPADKPRPPVLADGKLRVEVAATGSLAENRLPELGVRIELENVKAVVVTDAKDLAVEVPKLEVELRRRQLTVPPFQVNTPFGALTGVAHAGPLVDPLAVLTVAGVKDLVKPLAIPFDVALGTAPDRPLDLAKVAAWLPMERKPELARFHPQGTIAVKAGVSGTAEKPSGAADLRVEIGGVTLGAHVQSEDVKAKVLDGAFELKATKLADTLQALAPGTPAGPLEKLPANTEITASGTLKGKPGSYELKGEVAALDLSANLAGTLDDLPRPQETKLEGKWTLASLERLKPLFPEPARAKLEEIKPQFKLGGPLAVRGRGPRHEFEAGVDLTDVHAAWQGFTGPVKLDLDRLSVLACTSVVQGAPSPWNGICTVSADGGRLNVMERTIPIAIVPSRIAFSPDRVSTEDLHLKLVDQDIDLKLDFSRDETRTQRIDVDLNVPGLDLGHVTQTVGGLPSEVAVNGKVGLHVTARGPLAHPELIDPNVDLTIPVLDVKHPALKGLPFHMTGGHVQVTRDDVVIPAADKWNIMLGSQQFNFPIAGSIKEMAHVPNLFKADPKKIGPMIVERIGGEKRLAGLLGEDQTLRLIGDKLYKVKIHIKVADKPEPWEFKGALAPEDTQHFREQTHEIVEKYTIMAKQKLAETMGFRKAVYGEENYKFLKIEHVGVLILDTGFNMVYPKEIPFWRLTVTPAEW